MLQVTTFIHVKCVMSNTQKRIKYTVNFKS